MPVYSLSHLSDGVLLQQLSSIAARGRATTAELLAHIAETDARQLYRPAAHPSMHSYCVHVLRLSDSSATKHTMAAKVAREYPGIFEMVAEGRLHLGSLVTLAAHLRAENAEELLTAAQSRTRAELESYLAERARSAARAAAGQIEADPVTLCLNREEPQCFEQSPGIVVRTSVMDAPSAEEERTLIRLAVRLSLREKLDRAKALLGHRLRSGDPAEVIERALDELIAKLESRKLRTGRKSSRGSRHVPESVRSAVWERDGGQCTFKSEAGQRCSARHHLEFDHAEEFARGGTATVSNIRLLCRTHNQFAAEKTYGAGFMDLKRRESAESRERAAAAKRDASEARDRAAAEKGARVEEAAREKAAVARQERDLGYALHTLGYRKDDIRRAAALCAGMAAAPIEDRLRLVFKSFAPTRGVTRIPAPAQGAAPAGPAVQAI